MTCTPARFKGINYRSELTIRFFNKPVDNLTAEPVIARYLLDNFPDLQNSGIIISKNAGGTKRVTAMADRLKTNFAMIHRERYHVRFYFERVV